MDSNEPVTTIHVSTAELAIVQGDITAVPADAIVNAANESLRGGGGVDGAIHRVGGPAILRELKELYPSGTATGTAVVTTAGNLPATWVIHAVGPRWRDGAHGEEQLLRSAYEAAMTLAAGLEAASVTFPAISTGIYGYPLDDGARVALETVHDRLLAGGAVQRATFVLRGDESFEAFARALRTVDVPPR
jgi:O-acetyl-ADP-ribose deacetylase (regulator of RNase III)